MQLLSKLLIAVVATATATLALATPTPTPAREMVASPIAPFDATWTAPPLTGVETEYSMNRPDGNRTFWGYVPSSYTGQSAVPLVFAFHGLGDDCHRFGHETGMVDKAEAAGFILAYPCGTPGGFFGVETAWNAGTCCMEGSKVDDIGFAREIVSFFRGKYEIDAARVFTSGFSNGAFMTETLLCNSSDVFQAGASVSGTTVVLPGNAQGMANCDTEHAAINAFRPLLHIHGTWDPIVPWGGDAILGFPDIPTDFARWAQRNRCTGEPVNTFTNGTFSNSVYTDCAAPGQTIELVKHDGGVHSWPSDQYFDTTTYIWNFFSKINAPADDQ